MKSHVEKLDKKGNRLVGQVWKFDKRYLFVFLLKSIRRTRVEADVNLKRQNG